MLRKFIQVSHRQVTSAAGRQASPGGQIWTKTFASEGATDSSIAETRHGSAQVGTRDTDAMSPEERKAMVNRLLYRSKQRGFLEMDLLLGLWAQQNVETASPQMISAFEELLHLENPDLFKWITGQERAPSDLEQNLAFQAVQASVQKQVKGVVREAKTEPGRPWLRGWDDWKREQQSS